MTLPWFWFPLASMPWLGMVIGNPLHPLGYTFPPERRGDMTARLSVRVADQAVGPGLALVTMTVTVEGGPTLEVETPRLEEAFDTWELEPDRPIRKLAFGRATWASSIVLRQVKAGNTHLPTITVRMRERPESAWQRVVWEDVLREVREVSAPLGPLPPPAAWKRWVPATAVACGIVVLIAVYLLFWRRPSSGPSPLSPSEWALRELARIETTILAEGVDIFTPLSVVLRRYLEDRFGLHATRLTTAEFLLGLRSVSDLADTQQAVLRDLLERCDLAKFACAAGSIKERHETVAQARVFVEQTMQTTTTLADDMFQLQGQKQ